MKMHAIKEALNVWESEVLTECGKRVTSSQANWITKGTKVNLVTCKICRKKIK